MAPVRARALGLPVILGLAALALGPGGSGEVLPGVDLEPENQTGSGAPGETIAFNLTIQNTGTLSDTFRLNHSAPPAGWNASLNPTNVTLGGGESTGVSFRVTIATNAAGGANDTFNVTASHATNPTVTDAVNVTVRVPATAPASPEPDLVMSDLRATPASPAPGDAVVFVATVKNEGAAAAGDFTVSFRLDDGVDLGRPSVPGLAPGAQANVTSTMWTAASGSYAVRARADADGGVAESNESNNEREVGFTVGPASSGAPGAPTLDHDFVLLLEGPAKRARPGTNVSFVLLVRNTGRLADAVDLALAGAPALWSAGAEPVLVDPPPGAMARVHVWVQIPADAALGSEAFVKVSGASRADPSRSAAVTAYVVVGEPRGFPGGALWTAGALAVLTTGGLAVVAWSNENARFRLVALALPLFSRLERRDVLGHETRGRIHDWIQQSPGVHYAHLKRSLGLTNGTLTHHLLVLERQELISAQRDGMHKRFFPRGPRTTASPILSAGQQSVLEAVSQTPGLTQQDLAWRLSLSKQLVSYHVRTLETRGLVYVERVGRETRCYPPRAAP